MNVDPKTGREIVDFQLFDPLPKQKAFLFNVLDSPLAKFNWYVGGFGSGKTYVGSQLACRLAMQAPNGRGLIARQTAVDLKATTMKTFWEVVDKRLIAKHNKQEQLITFVNGHEIYYWGLDDIERLKSLEIGWFWFDEVNEIPEHTFNVAKGRLRHLAQPKRVGFITSNSEGKNWTYNQFILGRGLRRESDKRKYWTVKAPSNENIHLPEDYLDVLNSYEGDLYNRYVLASFNVFEGQIFPDFRRDVHCIQSFAIPKDWTRLGGIDHGERNPSTFLWCAVSPQGDLYFYREYYKAGEFVDQHVKNVYELNAGDPIDTIEIDPSTKSVRGSSGKKVDVEYRENWLKVFGEKMPLRYANNDVNAGIARMHKYLRVDPTRVHPITQKPGAPRVFIFIDKCPKLADEWESYKWKKISATDENDPQEKVRKKDDHLLDPARYIIMRRPDFTIGRVVQKFMPDDNSDPHGLYLKNAQKQFKDILLR